MGCLLPKYTIDNNDYQTAFLYDIIAKNYEPGTDL